MKIIPDQYTHWTFDLYLSLGLLSQHAMLSVPLYFFELLHPCLSCELIDSVCRACCLRELISAAQGTTLRQRTVLNGRCGVCDNILWLLVWTAQRKLRGVLMVCLHGLEDSPSHTGTFLLLHFFVQGAVESLAATLRLSVELNVSARRVRNPARKPLRITLRAMVS
jgi:hypothetical protein